MMKVKNYKLFAANGRFIRTATMVVLADGRAIKFVERMSKKAALANAAYHLSK